jgi:hypothetical protein
MRQPRKLETPEVADLAAADQVADRADGLVERRVGVRRDAGNRRRYSRWSRRLRLSSHGLQDPPPRHTDVVRRFAHRVADLVASTHLRRLALIARADDFFRFAARVDVGGVDEVDAGVERRIDDRLRRRGVGMVAEHHRAEQSGETIKPLDPSRR